MKLEKIRLEKIKVDGDLQVRDKINEDAVREYADVIRGGGKMPPVTVFFDGKSYHLADGWHRFFAHKQAMQSVLASACVARVLTTSVCSNRKYQPSQTKPSIRTSRG